jgi:hypothetical protein
MSKAGCLVGSVQSESPWTVIYSYRCCLSFWWWIGWWDLSKRRIDNLFYCRAWCGTRFLSWRWCRCHRSSEMKMTTSEEKRTRWSILEWRRQLHIDPDEFWQVKFLYYFDAQWLLLYIIVRLTYIPLFNKMNHKLKQVTVRVSKDSKLLF